MKPKLGSKHQQTHFQAPKTPSDFAFKLTQIAVSQICQSVGFKSSSLSALQTLTHVATLYLKTLAKEAASYANASNRTQSNLFDLINSLHDLSSIQGFTGASTLDSESSLLSSTVVNDLSVFVRTTDEIPFAKAMPRREESFPVKRDYSCELDLESRGMHIPEWLPGLPNESTYKKCKEMIGNRVRGDLVSWEDSDLVRSCVGISNKKGRSGGDLALERRRVRFKLRRVRM